MRLAGKVALVTGGGSGIGRAAAVAFAREGASVVVMSRSEGRKQDTVRLVEAAGGKALAITGEVSRSGDVQQALQQTIETFGRLDAAFNNAGVEQAAAATADITEEEWDRVLDINLKGVFLTCQAVARLMVRRGAGGRIVTISSGAANAASWGWAHYCASKAAVEMFTKVLAIELAPHDVTVTAVAPGLIEVPDADLAPEYVAALVAQTPVKRAGQPADVANAVLFLASPASSFITGTILGVDGGGLAGRPLPLSRRAVSDA